MTLELVPLARATLSVNPAFQIVPNIAGGMRLIAEITSAEWVGERLEATQAGIASADWAIVKNDGSGQINVRTTLKTVDGALIFVRYEGRVRRRDETSILTIAPLFETGDSRYLWLNDVQAIGRGQTVGDKLVYEIFEVR